MAWTIAARSSTLGAHSYPGPATRRGCGDTRTSARTRSGWEAANSAVKPQPSSIETSTGCSEPTASITAWTSSICSSSGVAPAIPSDIPLPRRSNRISRANDASRSRKRAKDGSSQDSSMFDRYDGTSTTSSGPSPTTW